MACTTITSVNFNERSRCSTKVPALVCASFRMPSSSAPFLISSSAACRASVHQRATTVYDVLGQEVSWEEAAAAMARGFMEALNLSLEERPPTSSESDLAAKLREEKYIGEAWNRRV